MSQTPQYDAAVAKILVGLKPGERVCALTGKKWMMAEEEIGWYKKFNVPPPKVSPQTIWKQHGLWLVGFQFWYQKHPLTGKPLIGIVHPASVLKMLPDQELLEKDFSSEAVSYDARQPFFEQWRRLQLRVPFPTSHNHLEPKNSITFGSQGDEDSYFVGTSRTKKSFFCHFSSAVEDSAEIFESVSVTQSYNIVHSFRIFRCQYVQESFDCLNSAFLFDCRNCENCFGAINQRNKKYLWFNEQLSKDEWETRRAGVDLGSRKVAKKYQQEFVLLITKQGIWPENFNDCVTNSTGEYLNKTVNVQESYFCGENALNQYRVAFSIGSSTDCAMSSYVIFAHDVYHSSAVSRSSDCRFCFFAPQSNHLEYCLLCYNCEYCFGCVGLNRKQFCIFNQQYSEEEYWKRIDELKCAMLERGEYGEFFPVAFSPRYWADSHAVLYGLTGEEAKKMSVLDFNPESFGATGQELSSINYIDSSTIPDKI